MSFNLTEGSVRPIRGANLRTIEGERSIRQLLRRRKRIKLPIAGEGNLTEGFNADGQRCFAVALSLERMPGLDFISGTSWEIQLVSLSSSPRQLARGYARVPVNGKLPIGPMLISPLRLSPATLPVNSSVSGIGLVIDTFQVRSSPLAVPSKISAELPSAPCAPANVPPEFFSESVAL